jgi:small-conductance mechanosensitive channel
MAEDKIYSDFVEWWKIAQPLAIFTGCIVAGLVIRNILFRWVHRWSIRSGHQLDSVIVPTLRTPIFIWSLILGFDLATRNSVLPRRYVQPMNITLEALWIISLTIVAAQICGSLVRFHSTRTGGTGQLPTLTITLSQLLVSILGLLFLLNHFRVNITPLLTALGVGGLAVALALQDTLANLFSGFYISVSSQIRVGDYIKLNTGEEGYVNDITWRSTTLRSLGSNYIFIPNSKLAQAIVTNYNLPGKSLGLDVKFHVAFDADTDRIEAMILDEAMSQKIDGLIVDPPPSIQWSSATDFSLLLALNFRVVEFVNQYGVQSELRKRIFKRFRKEGVAMVYPTQSIFFQPTNDLPSER